MHDAVFQTEGLASDSSGDWEGVNALCHSFDSILQYESDEIVDDKHILEVSFSYFSPLLNFPKINALGFQGFLILSHCALCFWNLENEAGTKFNSSFFAPGKIFFILKFRLIRLTNDWVGSSRTLMMQVRWCYLEASEGVARGKINGEGENLGTEGENATAELF